MARRHNISIFALVFLGVLFGAGFAHAQIGPGPAPVQYIVAPETPGPQSPVYIEVQGVGDFLGNAQITWTVNGKVVSSGKGNRTVSFTTGALGSRTAVSVDIESATYGSISRTFSFTPSRVNLTWEADTTAPPLYAGRSLYSAGSRIKVYAFPEIARNGSSLSASSLSYQWSVGGTPQPAASGTGRNTFSFDGDQLHQGEVVAVNVSSGSSAVGHAEATIPASSPLLLLYAHDPLRGVLYNHAFSNSVSMNSAETTFRAEPYFFSTASARSGSLRYSWTLNGQPASGPDAQNGELTLRQTGNGDGQASLAVSLQNNAANQILQAAQTALTITFGQINSASQSAFGI